MVILLSLYVCVCVQSEEDDDDDDPVCLFPCVPLQRNEKTGHQFSLEDELRLKLPAVEQTTSCCWRCALCVNTYTRMEAGVRNDRLSGTEGMRRGCTPG